MEDNNKIEPKNITPEPAQKFVKTYAEDMAGAIGDESGGLIKNIIREEEARDQEKTAFSPDSRENRIFMALGALFLVSGLGIFGFLFIAREQALLYPPAQLTQMIFADANSQVEIAGKDKDQIALVAKSSISASNLKRGGIEALYFTKDEALLGLRGFMESIRSNWILPDGPVVEDNFLFGAYSDGEEGEGGHIFILIRTRSFPDILKSLREWEGKMFLDLHDFFRLGLSAETSYLLTKDFEHGFVENKNARILYAADGTPALMYVFADENHVVIADSALAVKEVIFRLAGNKIAE